MSAHGDENEGHGGRKRKHDVEENQPTLRKVKRRRQSAKKRESNGTSKEEIAETPEEKQERLTIVGQEDGSKDKKKRERKKTDVDKQGDDEPKKKKRQRGNGSKKKSMGQRQDEKVARKKSSQWKSKDRPSLTRAKEDEIQSWAEQSSGESTKAVTKISEKKDAASRISSEGWVLSPTMAGRYLDFDPIFVQDYDGQEYLISANEREAQLLSLDASLVVRTFPAPPNRSITSVAAKAAGENMVRVALNNWSVYTWDWTAQQEVVHDFDAPGTIVAMASARHPGAEHSSLIYISQGFPDYTIYSEGPSLVLFETKQQLQSIQVLGDMEFIIAHGPDVVVVGAKKSGEHTVGEFVWTQIPLVSKATCIHARLLPTEPASRKSKAQQPGLSLAIGNEDGQIHLYDDVSSVSGRQGKPQLPPPRILHWHRDAVSSVKFSQDGNYLISGGKETVLVLWQLQTAKKQFLPHLTSAIERVVVNPRGDRYAIQMGDNSIMVLSTSELKPVANFAGLQMPVKFGNSSDSWYSSLPAVLHPQYSDQLLLSVPSTQPKSPKDVSTRPFLQSFDLGTSRHIARQALTRNNVTDFNLGPEQTPIIPPDVKLLSISHDGSWLATVDEWMPPAHDLEHLASGHSDLESTRQSRREVFLKFWQWDNEAEIWTLTTRADSPHSAAHPNSIGSGRVLALVSDPSTNSFATLGEDACLKIWKPKRRTRHGVAIKDRANADLMEWTCKRSIQLPRFQDQDQVQSTRTHSDTACLSYTHDGSLLAAACSTPTEDAPVVHFLNPSTGECIPKSGFAAHSIVAMGFVDQYFIAVSHPAAYVWDLVNESLMYKIKLASKNKRDFTGQASPLLAIDRVGGTFVIVKGGKKREVEVYSPRSTGMVYKRKFEASVEGILTSEGCRGYTVVFQDATIRKLGPATAISGRSLRGTGGRASASAPEELSTAIEGGEEQDVDMPDSLQSAVRTDGQDGKDEEDDRPVVRSEELARLFDTPQSFALPPVREMFEGVVGLFGRRPIARPAVEVS